MGELPSLVELARHAEKRMQVCEHPTMNFRTKFSAH
jgi:hypothetical protein